MKKFLSGALACTMAFSLAMVPACPVAAETEAGSAKVATENSDVYGAYPEEIYVEKEYGTLDSTGLYKYDIVDNAAKITSYVGDETNVVIPDTVDGYTVTAIAKGAFHDKRAVTITIPATITSIEEGAFQLNIRLCNFIVEANNTAYKVVNNALVTTDGKLFVAYPSGRTEKSYVVPDGVECIGKYAFAYDDNLREVTLPDSVKVINDCSFCATNITDITFGNSLTTIGKSAFYQGNLECVVIPDSVTAIGSGAFSESDTIKTVTLGKNVKTIGANAFNGSDSIVELHIPALVTSIGECAITRMKSLTQITVDEDNTAYKIVNHALLSIDGTTILAFPASSQFTSYVVPDSVVEIGPETFAHAGNLKQIILPEGLEIIGSSAFQYCSGLTEIKISNTVNIIGVGAFCGCSGLTGIVIPPNVEVVDSWAFKECDNLKSIFIASEVGYIWSTAFEGVPGIEKVYYVGSSEEWAELKNVTYIVEFANAEIYFLDNLKDFVDRMYKIALGRDYDAVGLNTWVLQLVEETRDGAGLAKEFILGEEFALRNLSDEQFVGVLYATFFNREADAAGKELWLATLAGGVSREYVLSQFVNLGEFTMLCADYGINRGVMFPDGSVAAPGLPQFVSRLYEQVLGRGADSEGLYAWTVALATKTITAEEAAVNFFISEEYALKNKDSEAFVTDCYKVFMDREADTDGLSYWVSCLETYGVSREWVISEFAKSAEFKEIATKYGL